MRAVVIRDILPMHIEIVLVIGFMAVRAEIGTSAIIIISVKFPPPLAFLLVMLTAFHAPSSDVLGADDFVNTGVTHKLSFPQRGHFDPS